MAPAKRPSPEQQVEIFIDRYAPEIATIARGALEKVRAQMPGATELVYDNYNGLVIGFGPSERPSEAVLPSRSIRSGSTCTSSTAPRCRIRTCF